MDNCRGGEVRDGDRRVAVVAVAIAAIITLAIADEIGSGIGTIATGAMGVLGTIVGAYFGIKTGTDTAAKTTQVAQASTLQATTHAAEANAAARVYAGFVPTNDAPTAHQQAMEAAREARATMANSVPGFSKVS